MKRNKLPLNAYINDNSNMTSVNNDTSQLLPGVKAPNVLTAKKYALDSMYINGLYNISTKQGREYHVVEKKVLFDKEVAKAMDDDKKEYGDIDNSYYSNYKAFRNYLMTGYSSEYLQNELQKIRTLIAFSKDLRKDVSKQYNLKTELNEGGNGNDNVYTHTNNKQLYTLLKLKSRKQELNNNSYYFRLFSEHTQESDVNSIPEYVNFTTVKYHNQNIKLTKSCHIENMFIECVTDIKKCLKQATPITVRTSLKSINEIKKNCKVPSIQSIFHGRDVDYFKSIDNFMNNYIDNSATSKNKEHLLFKEIYNILCKYSSSCKNFMSYLYTKSFMFKYIYDIFTIEAKLNFIDKADVQVIPKLEVNEPFLNESARQLFLDNSPVSGHNSPCNRQNEDVFINDNDENAVDVGNKFDKVLGNVFMDKVAFLNENVMGTERVEQLGNYLDKCKGLLYETYLLISKDYEFVLFTKEEHLLTEHVNGVGLYFFVREEFPECYSGIDSNEETIVIMKVKEKVFLLRFRNSSFERLKRCDKKNKLIGKYSKEVFPQSKSISNESEIHFDNGGLVVEENRKRDSHDNENENENEHNDNIAIDISKQEEDMNSNPDSLFKLENKNNGENDDIEESGEGEREGDSNHYSQYDNEDNLSASGGND